MIAKLTNSFFSMNTIFIQKAVTKSKSFRFSSDMKFSENPLLNWFHIAEVQRFENLLHFYTRISLSLLYHNIS